LKLVSGMNPTCLGLTLLAFGNSAGDMFTNLELSRLGFGVMAITACYAG